MHDQSPGENPASSHCFHIQMNLGEYQGDSSILLSMCPGYVSLDHIACLASSTLASSFSLHLGWKFHSGNETDFPLATQLMYLRHLPLIPAIPLATTLNSVTCFEWQHSQNWSSPLHCGVKLVKIVSALHLISLFVIPSWCTGITSQDVKWIKNIKQLLCF